MTIIPDELKMIKTTLIQLADGGGIDIIFTTVDTGFLPWDITPEATMSVVDCPVSGIPEALQQASTEKTKRDVIPAAAGICGKILIINPPGKLKVAMEYPKVFLPVMQHALEILRGDAHECARRD
ncbi:MAG: molybdenum cofactor biosynthesis protein [Chloroflexi bacterium]|nr:molybdenum cofactor biosynthesis protein [Chloroflexota bacterium]